MDLIENKNAFQYSSGSSGRVRVRVWGAEKHEIYKAAFGGNLFYDLFSQGQGGHGPLGPPGSAAAVGCVLPVQ